MANSWKHPGDLARNFHGGNYCMLKQSLRNQNAWFSEGPTHFLLQFQRIFYVHVTTETQSLDDRESSYESRMHSSVSISMITNYDCTRFLCLADPNIMKSRTRPTVRMIIMFCLLSIVEESVTIEEVSSSSLEISQLNSLPNLKYEEPSKKKIYVPQYKKLPLFNFGIGKRWIDNSEDKVSPRWNKIFCFPSNIAFPNSWIWSAITFTDNRVTEIFINNHKCLSCRSVSPIMISKSLSTRVETYRD